MKVKSILVSQPKPAEGEKSPFFDLAEKHKLKVDFRPFIQVDPIAWRDFKRNKVYFQDFTAVILTSRNAVDHFFRMCTEQRVEMSQDTKYFCINESLSYYLQKYIQLRKRKVFFGKTGATKDMLAVIKNHPNENFLYPCSDIRKKDIPDFMNKNKLKWKEAIIYKTVSADLSDLSDVFYDIIVFYSPADIKSLFENFPDFQQNNTRIAGFGATTAKAIKDAKLKLNISAPTPENPSMTGAIEAYILKVNK